MAIPSWWHDVSLRVVHPLSPTRCVGVAERHIRATTTLAAMPTPIIACDASTRFTLFSTICFRFERGGVWEDRPSFAFANRTAASIEYDVRNSSAGCNITVHGDEERLELRYARPSGMVEARRLRQPGRLASGRRADAVARRDRLQPERRHQRDDVSVSAGTTQLLRQPADQQLPLHRWRALDRRLGGLRRHRQSGADAVGRLGAVGARRPRRPRRPDGLRIRARVPARAR